MNQYVLKQRVFSLGDNYIIQDESGQERFRFDSAFFSLGKKLTLQDMAGRDLVLIRQRLLSFGPTYEITEGGRMMAIVKKSLFTFFNCRFTVDMPGPDDLEASGSFLEYEYAFIRGGHEVAVVSKKWFSWGDTYGVRIADGQDDVLILASTIVIDLACHDDD
ncbi:MAG: hypothetical protein M2R45_01680 [Verrucomicrobia subdivision 3 bacterium]|nr:hypothetical protein [Limisphaerales bacterium]MCS1413419.1 hypothetical protein [Limisphaerales bacterium]